MSTKSKAIGECVNAVITSIYAQADYSSGKAMLAKLRRSIGKTDPSDVYPFLFQMIPEELLGHTATLSDEEKAIIWSLQFYALLQQGRKDRVDSRSGSLGNSLAGLRSENSNALDRRFNAMILSDTEEEFQMHLRHMIQLYKSKSNGSIDFAQLAADIYKVIHWPDGKEQIRLSWSRDYYKIHTKKEDKKEEK